MWSRSRITFCDKMLIARHQANDLDSHDVRFYRTVFLSGEGDICIRRDAILNAVLRSGSGGRTRRAEYLGPLVRPPMRVV